MSRHAYGGQGQEARVLNQVILASDTAPHDSKVTTLIPPSNASYQLCTEAYVRYLELTAGDTMTGASHTLVCAKGAFTANDVGATVVISGSASNNTTFTVASVTNATTIVFSAGGVNETFTGTERAILTQTNTLAGSWSVLVSNSADMVDDTPGVAAGTKIAKFSDLTADLSQPLDTVDPVTAATQNQIVDLQVGFGAVKVRFTATAGHGRAVAYVKSGSY